MSINIDGKLHAADAAVRSLIDSLKSDLETCRVARGADKRYDDIAAARLADVAARRDALRAALGNLLKYLEDHDWQCPDAGEASCQARAALAGAPGEPPVALVVCAALVSQAAQDCSWPVCGCDPAATKVIEALQTSGWAAGDWKRLTN